jgi:RNA polymerase sigma factor (sigma-70 family)
MMEKEQLVSLVTAAQQGDGKAMNELFNAFYNDVYYFALKTVKDDQLACDVTQEAFMEILNTLGKLQEPAAFVTWMKQITYHQCTRYFKKKKDVLVDEDEDGNTVFDTLQEENAEFIPDEALERSDFKKIILGILDELSEE